MRNPRVGFGDVLAQKMEQYGPLCVGIDPHPQLLQQWGLPATADGVERFARLVLEACAGKVAAVKPQVAFFESYGSSGFLALERCVQYAQSLGLLVISDAKRGDIGSTMSAYAHTWLDDSSPLASDALTLSPYLGFGSLAPALELSEAQGRGVFVLALTSNPEGKSVQHRGGDCSVAAEVIRSAQERNARQSWRRMGSCGLVVGATVADALKLLSIDLSGFNGPILAPGYGAQGATAEQLYEVFSGCPSQVLVNSSRGVLSRGPSLEGLIDAIESSQENLKNNLNDRI
ncbi:orotidine-5'-phosphate decarboxylase [Rothia sp. CCM 9418]|uniref:orotidine-5'-phosphate decarboxylase n=1 Tax=Rothia sp. CCM 9418 TaxID=3402661 RepID=UPI003AE16132